MINFKTIPKSFTAKHGNIYCASCARRGMRVLATHIPTCSDIVGVLKEFGSCEFHIEENELLLTRRILKNVNSGIKSWNVRLTDVAIKKLRGQNEKSRLGFGNCRK